MEIISNWNPVPNKYIFKELKAQVGNNSDQYDLLSLTLQGVIKRDMENPQGKFPAEFNTYQPIKEGDFIFCLFDVEETPRAVGLSPFDGMITGAYTAMRLNRDASAKFLLYYYLNLDKDKRLRYLYKGLRNTIPKDSFFSLKTLLPPLPTQTRIANFLDEKTGLIDKAIAQKQRLIELLEERRQILIHQAVTHGLDPNVELRDSGVDWIGKVPKHWEVKKLKHYAKMRGGYAFPSTMFKDQGVQILKISNTYQNRLSLDRDQTYVDEIYLEQLKEFVVTKGDILMSLTGTLGKEDYGFAILLEGKDKYLLNQRVGALFLNSNLNPEYCVRILRDRHYLNKLYSLPSGTKQANLSNADVLNQYVIVPPLKLQSEIELHLKDTDKVFEKLIANVGSQIAKLKEYKSTLINSAVTGQIEV